MEKSYNEDPTSGFYRPRPANTVAPVAPTVPSVTIPAPSVHIPSDHEGKIILDYTTHTYAKALKGTGLYEWSDKIKLAMDGYVEKEEHKEIIKKWYERQFGKVGV